MTIGLVGRKCGMTRIFTEDGVSIPVTVIEVEPNRVTQFKSEETDGYRAVQVTVGERRASRVSKAQAGHFAKAKVVAGRNVLEFRLEEGDFQAGDLIKAIAPKVGGGGGGRPDMAQAGGKNPAGLADALAEVANWLA